MPNLTTDCKPCPFCGVLNVAIDNFEVSAVGKHLEYRAMCNNCGACGPTDLGTSGAVEMWNLRREYDPKHPNNAFVSKE